MISSFAKVSTKPGLAGLRNLLLGSVFLAAMQAMPAHAVNGFVINDPDCSSVVGSVATPKFDAAYFNQLTDIWASSDGATGVFFLKGKNGTVVVKFEETVNVGTVVSRRVLKSLNVPSDTLMAEFRKEADILKIFKGITSAAANPAKPNIVESTRQARFNQLVNRLTEKFNGSVANNLPKNPPRQVIITQFLTGFAGSRNLADSITYTNGIASKAANDSTKNEAHIQFLGAAKALANPHNQTMLGYLYVVDILLGNNDRLLRSWANIGNIFVATGQNNAACLVAIDNEAHAPRAQYLAMIDYANSKVTGAIATRVDKATKRIMPLKSYNGVLRFQTPQDPDNAGTVLTGDLSKLTLKWIVERVSAREKAKNPITDARDINPLPGDTVKGDAAGITGDRYLNLLMGHYTDDMGGVFPVFFGPLTALAADFYWARQAPGTPVMNTDPPSAATCQPNLPAGGPGSVKRRVIRHLRAEFSTYISEYLTYMQQSPSEVATTARFRNSAGISISSTNHAQNVFICRTDITATSATYGPALASVGLNNISIDWVQFDENFMRGTEMALADLKDFEGMKPILTAAFATMPNFNTTDVHISGVMARAHFMSLLASLQGNFAPDQLITSMTTGPNKPDYAMDAEFPASTYTYRNLRGQGVWVPN